MTKKPVAHEDFARRFVMACDNNSNVPEANYGRLVWIANEFKNRFDVDVTAETVRRWAIGAARPHPYRKIEQLAELLQVDVAWLATGSTDGVDQKQKRIRNEVADGAVNLIAGLVQMSGSHPAFPTADDRFAKENNIDIYAIIRGIQHAFHISTAELKEGGPIFHIPVDARNAIVLGVVPEGGLKYSIVNVDMTSAEKVGTRRGNMLTVPLSAVEVKPVTSFAERF